MNYSKLWTELSTDPATVNYLDPTNPDNDQENVELINARSQLIDKTTITNTELWENTDLTEYRVLGIEARDAYSVLINLENIDVAPGTNSRDALAAIFPAGTTTRQNLIDLVSEQIETSRREILGLEPVYIHHIEEARRRNT